MKCPHCRITFHDQPSMQTLGEDVDGIRSIYWRRCPSCKKFVVSLQTVKAGLGTEELVYPRAATRPPCSPEVPERLAEDFHEACLVIADSPKASAALSRRCLQHLLREYAGVKKGDLSSEIQQVIDSGKVPSFATEAIDAIRNTGNFAAHPAKSSKSGEIIDVEPGEAEWNLDVLEMLFDFYFVQPALLAGKRAALNKELSEAGKPPMK